MTGGVAASGAYLASGHVIAGRYQIGAELGRGGSSVVYAAVDRTFSVEVAVKLLVPPPAAARRARERMRREVQAVRGLSHENIVAVFDFVDEGPWSCIVMERVAGPDLSVHLRKHGPLPTSRAAMIAAGVADALHVAHRSGILHRDVKPSNILLDADGRPRLADFGSAKMDGLATMTETGGLVGTMAYLPPEVLAGRRADARSDVYALGLTLYVMLTGRPPAGGSLHHAPPPAADGHAPRDVVPELPGWIDRVVATATAADPAHRFPTAHQMAETLREAVTPRSAPGLERPGCVICSGPDPLSLGVCTSCGGSPTRGDTLLVVRRSPARADRVRTESSIRDLFGDHIRGSSPGELAHGHAPLVRVSSSHAVATRDALSSRGIPVRLVPARRAWMHLPAGVYLLLIGIVVTSGSTGLVGPLVTGLLWGLAHVRMQRPAVSAGWRGHRLPAETETRAVETLRTLGPGTARNLLAEVVQLSLPLYRVADADQEFTEQLDRFLAQACEAAQVVEDMDKSLTVLARQREEHEEIPAPWLDAQASAEQVRAATVQRFLEASAWLSRARSLSARLGEATPTALAGLAAEIEQHTRVQIEAREEVERILVAS